MGNMKANRKFVEGEDAVSAVIGVILMVAITVAIAATVYVYVSGMLGGGTASTPSVSITSSPDGKGCTITVGTPTSSDIEWEDVWYTLTNVSGQKEITGEVSFSASRAAGSYVKGGQAMYINAAIVDEGLDDKNNLKYSFTLVYNTTGGTMGVVTWTQ